jgi:hypothetical protein
LSVVQVCLCATTETERDYMAQKAKSI